MKSLRCRCIGGMMLVVILVVGIITPLSPVRAAPGEQTGCGTDFEPEDWRELRLDSFSIIYLNQNAAVAVSIRDVHGQDLEDVVAGFASVFGVAVPLPISIRIYPTVDDYYCLNALAPTIDPNSTHSHIGTREIVLIGENIIADMGRWQAEMLNAFRHELVILFAEQVSGGSAPPGLLEGLGGYAEDPNEVFEGNFAVSGLENAPDMTWQELWENRPASDDVSAQLQAASTVAYLIDVHGWNSFAAFLEALGSNEGYRQALNQVYDVNVQSMQRHWRQYFSAYVGGRWRANVFHSFDLSVFEQMIEAGAYADALEGIREAMPLLQAFGDDDGVARAAELEIQAEKGVEAGALAAQARQALLEGNYLGALGYANQSLALYNELNDNRRLEEVQAYLELAQQVLELRGELEQLEQGSGFADPTIPRRLVQIGRQLAGLGDGEGVSLVNLALAKVSALQRMIVFWISAVGAGLCGLLLLFRLWKLRKKRPPEADLL